MPKFVSPAIKRLRSAAGVDESAGKAEKSIPASPLVVKAASNVSSFDDVFNKFEDLEYFLELVEVEQTALTSTEQEIRLEGWRRIHDKGVEKCCDWSNEAWDTLEQMWEACVKQSKELNLAALSATTSGMRSGMKRETYDDIYRFLRSGEYPMNIADNAKAKCNYRSKCAEYSINSDDQIEYSGRGPKKIVLLEGEVEPVVNYVHYALGHADYATGSSAISAHFHASCFLQELSKALVGGCTTYCIRLATQSNYKSVRITFQRTPHLHIEVLLNNKRLSQSDIECVFKSSDNVARVGMPISNYKRICTSLITMDDVNNDRKDYKYDRQKGLCTSSGKIVLDDSIGADVIFQIHTIYGHITNNGLKDLVSLHFYCPGISGFSLGIRSFCSFCGLRSGTSKDATPSEVYRNANYDVVVDWKDGQRKISISPIGLDQSLVDSYVEGILKKKNTTMEQITTKQAPANVNSEMLPIHHKILRLSNLTSIMVNRSSDSMVVPKKSALKRRRKCDGSNPDARSVHWAPINETQTLCDSSVSQFDFPCKDTTETADVVPDFDDADCFSDDDSPIVPNLSWTRDFERSYAEFAVPQSEEYEAQLEMYNPISGVTPTSPADSHCLVSSDKLDQVDIQCEDGISENCSTTNTPEDSFFELQPVVGYPQYLSSSAFMSYEDFYLMPYKVEYPDVSLSDVLPLPTVESSSPSLGQVYMDAMQSISHSHY